VQTSTAPHSRAAPIGVLGTGAYLPARIRTNDEVASGFDIDAAWITSKTGINERRVASPDQATSDLATLAGRQALKASGLRPQDLDLLVVATSTPDCSQPATACLVQAQLGARCPAFDINAVCTGFIYAVALAAATLGGAPHLRYALVIGADTFSRILDPDDRATSVLFGDGAGAAVLGPVPDGYGIIASDLGADGASHDLVKVPAGGSRTPPSAATLVNGDHYFKMHGRGVREFVWRRVPQCIHAGLRASGLSAEDIHLIVPHQANGRLLRDCLSSMDLRPDQAHYTLERYGNTGAASVAITLDDALCTGRIDDGDNVLLLGFGGGMTWGSVVMRWWAR
jgi:3-oxoacyl-(acyl-carrier-protein) synthase III